MTWSSPASSARPSATRWSRSDVWSRSIGRPSRITSGGGPEGGDCGGVGGGGRGGGGRGGLDGRGPGHCGQPAGAALATARNPSTDGTCEVFGVDCSGHRLANDL